MEPRDFEIAYSYIGKKTANTEAGEALNITVDAWTVKDGEKSYETRLEIYIFFNEGNWFVNTVSSGL